MAQCEGPVGSPRERPVGRQFDAGAGVLLVLASAALGYLGLVQLGYTGDYVVPDPGSAALNALGAVSGLAIGGWLIRRASSSVLAISVVYAGIVVAAGGYQLTQGIGGLALAVAVAAGGLAGVFSVLALGRLGHAGLGTQLAAEPVGRMWRQATDLAACHRTWTLVAVVAVFFLVYLQSRGLAPHGRSDFYYLADAFLHGRVWLDQPLDRNWIDSIVIGTKTFVPFGPFPAIALTPLVAVFGLAQADAWNTLVDSFIAALDVGFVWVLLSRISVRSLADRVWICVLFGLSTQIWWVVVNGGVWHTSQLIACMLTLAALVESLGKSRPMLLGLLVGAAFLTRAPLALAIPFFAWIAWQGARSAPTSPVPFEVRTAALLRLMDRIPDRYRASVVPYAIGLMPSAFFFLWYNWVRFGAPLESGYALATVPPFLEALRQQGLFSLSHLAMNLDYLLFKLPKPIAEFPFIQPDGFGMSIFITSPGLLLSAQAPWRSPKVTGLALTALAVLIPSLLYYGGGWIQYGYRYALDSIPFAIALCGYAATRRPIGWPWKALILVGVVVGLIGVYWHYQIWS